MCLFSTVKKCIVKEEETNLELNWSLGEGERRDGGDGDALQGSGSQNLGIVSLHGRASCCTTSGL